MSAESLTAILAPPPLLVYIQLFFFFSGKCNLFGNSFSCFICHFFVLVFSVSMNVGFKAHMICGQLWFQYTFWKAYMTSKLKTCWVWGWQLHPIKTYLIQKPQYQHLACWGNPYSQQRSLLMTPRTCHFNPHQYGPVYTWSSFHPIHILIIFNSYVF